MHRNSSIPSVVKVCKNSSVVVLSFSHLSRKFKMHFLKEQELRRADREMEEQSHLSFLDLTVLTGCLRT